MSAASAAAFVNSIGVNTHPSKPSSSYVDLAAVEAALSYLGVKNVRDLFSAPTDVTLFEQVAAATGVKFETYLNTGQTYTAEIGDMVADLNIIRAVEGVNEADGSTWTYEGLSGLAAAAAAEQALYAAIRAKSSTVGVVNFSYGSLSSFANAPNTSAYANDGNAHDYWGTGNPPGSSIPALLVIPRR